MKTNAAFSIFFLFYIAIAMAISISPSISYFIILVFLLTLILILLLHTLTYQHRLENGETQPLLTSISFSIQSTAIYFIILLLFSVFYWLAYYPGSFNLDAYGQWMQAHNIIPFNDWHPFTSTLIIKFILAIHDSFHFYIFAQIVLFSAAISFLLETLESLGIPRKVLLLTAIFLGLSPSIGLNTIALTKDVQFTILITVLIAFYIKIVASDGSWIKKPIHILLLSIFSALTTLVRHNGFFFTIPAWIILVLSFRKYFKYTLLAIVFSLLLIFIVKGPVSYILQVEKHNNTTGEVVGIPMAIMGNAFIRAPDELPSDVTAFLSRIAPYEEWKTHYIVGEWDSCKWVFGGTDLLKNESLKTILTYTWKTVLQFPQYAYDSVRENIRISFDLLHTFYYWAPDIYIEANPYGIVPSAVLPFQKIAEIFRTVSFLPFISVFVWNTGMHLSLILLFFCFHCKITHPRALLVVLPLVIYDFGTTLLLAGPNQRYFYCNAVLFIPIILFFLTQNTASN